MYQFPRLEPGGPIPSKSSPVRADGLDQRSRLVFLPTTAIIELLLRIDASFANSEETSLMQRSLATRTWGPDHPTVLDATGPRVNPRREVPSLR